MGGIMLSGGNESSSFLDNFTNNANADVWSDYYEELAWLTNVMPYDTLNQVYWNDIHEAGLYKKERIIVSPQQAEIKLDTGQEVLNFCANGRLRQGKIDE